MTLAPAPDSRAARRAEREAVRAAARAERLEHDARVWRERKARRVHLAAENAAAEARDGALLATLRGRRLATRARTVPEALPCTPETARCASGADAKQPTPACCVAHQAAILARVGGLLTERGVPWWIDYGALLGFCVSGGAETSEGRAYWNDKDVDICALVDDRAAALAIIPILRAEGFDAKYYQPRPRKWEWGDVIKVRLSSRNQNNLDLTFWARRPDGVLDRQSWAHTDQYKGREMPGAWVFPTALGTWEGVPVHVPAEPLRLVEHRYGAQWRALRPVRHDGRKRADPVAAARRRSARVTTPPRPRTVAVIVAAHRAQAWILESLAAIDSQQLPGGWKVDVRVGVDGCEETSAVLAKAGRAHWFAPENHGAYVMRNSLIAQAPADCYAIFDADDVMGAGYLASLVPRALRRGLAGSGRTTFAPDGRQLGRSGYKQGVTVFSARAWAAIGGFRGWRIAADWDAVLRAEALGYRVDVDQRPLYRRRRHGASLTRVPATALGSVERKRLEQVARQGIARGELRVVPETTALEWREMAAVRRAG